MSWVEGAMKVAGGAAEWYGMHQQERSDQERYALSAATDEQNAGQVKAAAQRRAQDERDQAALLESRARALAGGGASDPSVLRAMGEISAEGEYRSLSALYEGESDAQALRNRATATRKEAKDAKRAMQAAYASTIFNGGSQLYSKYGGGGAKTGYTDRRSFRADDPYRNRNYYGGGEGE